MGLVVDVVRPPEVDGDGRRHDARAPCNFFRFDVFLGIVVFELEV